MDEYSLVFLDLGMEESESVADIGYSSIRPLLPEEVLDNLALLSSSTVLDQVEGQTAIGINSGVMLK